MALKYKYKQYQVWLEQNTLTYAMKFKRHDTPKEERDAEYGKLHEMYAPRVKELILDLGGVFIKVGQVRYY